MEGKYNEAHLITGLLCVMTRHGSITSFKVCRGLKKSRFQPPPPTHVKLTCQKQVIFGLFVSFVFF